MSTRHNIFSSVVILMLLSGLLSGCVSTFERTTGEKPIKVSLDQMRAINISRLQKVSLGMSKQVALNLMGTKTFYSRIPESFVPNPYKIESSKNADGKNYEIIYYYTDIKRNDGAITDDELTPLVFENGVLIGWGWSFVEDNIKKFRIEVR